MLRKSGADLFWGKNACGKLIDHGVLGGTLKSTKIDKIHKIHAPKVQGSLKSIKNIKIQLIHASKSRGVFFLRSPKRRRQLRHRRTGLGDPKTGKNVKQIEKTKVLDFRMALIH